MSSFTFSEAWRRLSDSDLVENLVKIHPSVLFERNESGLDAIGQACNAGLLGEDIQFLVSLQEEHYKYYESSLESKKPLTQDFLDGVLSNVLENVDSESIEPILRFFRFPVKSLSQRGIWSILASEKIEESLKVKIMADALLDTAKVEPPSKRAKRGCSSKQKAYFMYVKERAAFGGTRWSNQSDEVKRQFFVKAGAVETGEAGEAGETGETGEAGEAAVEGEAAGRA